MKDRNADRYAQGRYILVHEQETCNTQTWRDKQRVAFARYMLVCSMQSVPSKDIAFHVVVRPLDTSESLGRLFPRELLPLAGCLMSLLCEDPGDSSYVLDPLRRVTRKNNAPDRCDSFRSTKN